MSLLRGAEPGAGLGTLCGLLGYSRQTYYKRGEDDDFKPLALEPMIVEKVKDYRRDNPRLGSVKLWLILKKLSCSEKKVTQKSIKMRRHKEGSTIQHRRRNTERLLPH